MRGEPIPFFQTFGRIFALGDYDDFSEQKAGRSVKYFFKLMIMGTILLFLFAIPVFMKFSENFDSSLSKFNSLAMPPAYSMKEPVVFFRGDSQKQITIDLASNATTIESGKMLVTNHSIIQRSWLGSEVTNITGYSNVLEHRETYKSLLSVALLFMLPSLIVLAYVAFGIKFLLMILAVSFAVFVISRVARFEISYLNCFNCTLYPFTIAILFSMIVFPYNIHFSFVRVEWLGYALSVLLTIVGIQSVGYFGKKPEKGERAKRRNYIELR